MPQPPARVRSGLLLALLPVACGLLASLTAARSGAQDQPEFVAAGLRLLADGRWDVYDDPWYQIGPLHLLLVGLVARVAGAVGADPVVVSVGAAWAALTVLAVLVARLLVHRASPVSRAGAAGVAAGGVVVAVVATARPVTLAHPEELAIALLWCLSAAAARDRRVVAAAVLVVVAAALKPTGALGAAVLLQLPARTLLVAGVATAAGSFATYAPFVLLGTFRMLHQEWAVTPWTLPWLLDPAATHAGWVVRLAQAGAVVVAVGVTAVVLRPPPAALVAVLVAVRLLLDPVYLVYYAAPLLLVVVLAAHERPTPRLGRHRLLVAVPLVLVVLAHAAAEPRTVLRYAVVLTVLAAVVAVWRPRRRAGQVPATPQASVDREARPERTLTPSGTGQAPPG
ncbi:hypothetical protein [Cellulomonas marina]|uniref:DUF2029 domain-containing protein n=1 Tax=Cellulomonas marina TaxID=988821 RepID=A0A1I0W8T9_9CELL|nr:hypothetical protein [Cellulomonas marina]GIG29124.1 hypothetical protein Cma02nite_17240 [Cellulomonas marina]SFA84680.1 hypothetical protein SAMN05421867_102256 [Cellulomonas marina]